MGAVLRGRLLIILPSATHDCHDLSRCRGAPASAPIYGSHGLRAAWSCSWASKVIEAIAVPRYLPAPFPIEIGGSVFE
jgi:hypothetical protein